jgi:hypothetical protein
LPESIYLLIIHCSIFIPERPSLEQLKKQAKSLLHARTKDPTALQQFHALLAFSLKSGVGADALSLALHDAQSVSAREYGFKSWYEMGVTLRSILYHSVLLPLWRPEENPTWPRNLLHSSQSFVS